MRHPNLPEERRWPATVPAQTSKRATSRQPPNTQIDLIALRATAHLGYRWADWATMHLLAETGTDVGALAAADPTLVSDIRGSSGRQFTELCAQAMASGVLWRCDTGADGAYLFSVFLDETPPPQLQAHLLDPIVIERFPVPSGRLLIGGEEVVVTEFALGDAPHMGREVEVPPADYHLTAYRVEWDNDDQDMRFDERATTEQRRSWKWGNQLLSVAALVTVLAILGTVISLRTFMPWWVVALPTLVTAASWAAAHRLRRTAGFASARTLYEEIAYELPSVVLVLERLP